ncbi:hypothetical protein ACEN9H_26130 [Massilia cellulosiltytica]|uniref:hypothetical protein n=1 Tax=Massilia cellulosiltytica TaxID=2683234 RepID=UPI0039B38E4E
MTLFADSRARGGMLILALAFIGGTGCVAIDAVNKNRYERQQRDAEAARQRRIAELAGAAAAGNPAARTSLAYTLVSTRDRKQADVPRARDLLEQASAQDYAPAQALLGEMLGGMRSWGGYEPFGANPRDRARGIVLLQRAATKICVVQPGPDMFRVEPALRAAQLLARAGRADESRLWRARNILHCGGGDVNYLSWEAKADRASSAERIDALALLTLTGNAAAVAGAKAMLPADMVGAADRLADDLRRQVAASERDYPAPPRKGLP